MKSPKLASRDVPTLETGKGSYLDQSNYVSSRQTWGHRFALPYLEEPAADADDVTERTSKRQEVA